MGLWVPRQPLRATPKSPATEWAHGNNARQRASARVGSTTANTSLLDRITPRRYSILSALFTGLAAGTYQATITLSVSGVSDPAANYETGHLLDECFLEQGVDPPPANVQGYLCAGETGGEVSTEDTGTVKVGVDGVQGSRSDSSLNLIASARTVRVTEEEAAADSSGFIFISKDTQGDNCHKRTGTTTSSCELVLRPGTLQLTLDFALSSPGIAVVQVQLIAEAWASGKNADSSAGCHLSVTSIEVASV